MRNSLSVLSRILGLVGLAVFGAGIAGESRHPLLGIPTLVTPLAFALGFGAVAYSAHLRKRLSAAEGSPRDGHHESRRVVNLKTALIGAFMILSIFWALGDWADAAGRGRAFELAEHLAGQPGVIVYSKDRLQMQGAGIIMNTFPETDSAYHFQYSGLRLLIHSGGKYFLVPSEWTPLNGIAIVLADSNDRRVEFTPPQ